MHDSVTLGDFNFLGEATLRFRGGEDVSSVCNMGETSDLNSLGGPVEACLRFWGGEDGPSFWNVGETSDVNGLGDPIEAACDSGGEHASYSGVITLHVGGPN